MSASLESALVTSTAVASLGSELLESVTQRSPLTLVIVDLLHAAASNDVVPAAPARVPKWQREALRHLADPELQTVVVYRCGLSSVGFTLYGDGTDVTRFDAEAGYAYWLGKTVPVDRMAASLAAALPRVSAPPGAPPHTTVSDTAFFAAVGWVAAYRDDWLPLGSPPEDAVVSVDDVRRGLSSDAVAQTLAAMAGLAAPATFARAYQDAPTAGIAELRERGILADVADGLVMSESGAALVGPMAFPAGSLSLLTTRLSDAAGSTTVVLVAPSGWAVTVAAVVGEDARWAFDLSRIDADGAAAAIRDALAPTNVMPTPLGVELGEWPAPLFEAATATGRSGP